MRSAIVIGTGGHSRVVLSLLAQANTNVIGLIELGVAHKEEKILQVPVLGGIEALEQFEGRGDIHVYLAVGDNALRRTWFLSLKARQFSLPNLLSPHAIVDVNARLGDANIICARAYIGPEACLGDNNLINTAAIVEHEARIGNHCHLAPSATVAGRSEIADISMLGAGATVIDSLRVAESTVVGAGAVVVRHIMEPGNTWLGVPARCAGLTS